MDIDFSLVLVSLVAFCGALWLLDNFFIKKTRLAAVENYTRNQAKDRSKEEIAIAIEEYLKEPLIIEYAKSFFPVLLIVLVLRSFLVEPFQIPTGSMIPTLNVGDFILVNKYAYGVRLPIIGTKIIQVKDPDRGEVIVFVPPHENKYYIKRVIGLPGDTVRYEDKTLFINGELISKDYVESIMIQTSIGDLPGVLYSETINGVEHATQNIDAVGRQRTRTNWVIPNGHYFMMGDNRDNSSDSRVWGTVPNEDIVGKAIAVWMHKEPGLHLPTFSRNQRIK
ncbi:MAG: signal peptidase I [Pseudomonadota bacterium]|nr:signal peptidase I [Pseudomonadota bacterium]HAI15943.1 signal peptidase I [Gammaproteobacteria bacterium]MEC8950818.1 signal peptidase I [Pseudomonadota bacterium]MEC9300076.1 signal peptidase I [Pseudomonadota bacterium]MED5386175.1 signal peptidase I [Pseudomonadota bacterium]|tara:strand:+ start:1947 stop:2786 length:840 start_codon:yes stop_codon:yes gene_type:complete